MEQKKILLEFIKKHPNLASGKFSNNFSQKEAQRLWQELTVILNSCGTDKDWKSWRKTWQDIRSRTKIKNSEYHKQRRRTGGGPCPEITTNEFENEVLDTIKLVSIQGHQEVLESATDFTFDSSHDNESVFEDDRLDDDYTQKIDEVPRALRDHNSVMISELTSSEAIPSAVPVAKQNPEVPIMKKKFPRAPRKKLIYASEAAENYKASLDKKNAIKSKYYEKKLTILERIAVAKEQSAAAKERAATALERSANAAEEIASELSTGIKAILEAFC
ncbi:unnamed protein product [Phaedon cochleariae]|uniref:Regulatory protein zeste n=1 Tax=Phaedon cochleariae TaxID=80249 RepID=A0A9N9SHB1_PHACE|nr:unnamed protein product [Phaedon cochleariae]